MTATSAPSKDIHAGREGVGKGLMGPTGGWGCERQRYLEETVRDPSTGWRLRFGMPERVIFGTAVDVAHGHLTAQVLAEPGIHPKDLQVAPAVAAGMSKARGDLLDHPWTEEEWATLEARLVQSMEKLTGLRDNYPKDYKGKAYDTTPPVLWPMDFSTQVATGGQWVGQAVRLLAQGRNGESFRVPNLVSGRSLVGTPDYTWQGPDEALLGWLDVKAVGRSYSYPKKWMEPEAAVYDLLLATLNGGEPPAVHAYLEYRRLATPYWHLTWAPVHSASVRLARALVRRWSYALDSGTLDGLSWSVADCAECPWREAIPGIHDGCDVGQAAYDIDPTTTTPQE